MNESENNIREIVQDRDRLLLEAKELRSELTMTKADRDGHKLRAEWDRKQFERVRDDKWEAIVANDKLKAELAEAHKACDGFSTRRSEGTVAYPLSLPERIRVLRRAITDYQRWMEQAERLVGHPLPVTDEDEVRLMERLKPDLFLQFCQERQLDTKKITMGSIFLGLYCDPVTRGAKAAWDAALASVSQQQAQDLH